MKRVRTFVAVELGQGVCGRVSRLIDRMAADGAPVRWVKPDTMHITLNFLGDVDERELHQVCDAVARSIADHDQFPISCVGVGAFPNISRPRTIWVGVEENRELLRSLQASTEAALAKLGFPKERRQYQPHLTIGRAKRERLDWRQLSELVEREVDFDGGSTAIEEVVVFSSELEPSGPVYHALARQRLVSADD